MRFTKSYLLLALFALLLSGCNKELKKEAEQLRQDNQQMQSTIGDQKKTIEEFKRFIDEINRELESSITDQTIIEKMRGESDVNQKIKILTHEISNMLDKSQEELDAKDKQLKNSRYSNYLLKKKVAELQDLMQAKNDSISNFQDQVASMNNQLDDMESKVRTLKERSNRQMANLNKLEDQMNTAAYVVGTASELLEKGVIDKVGGFLGIFGRTEKLSPDTSSSPFKKINIKEDKTIGINAKKVTLVTSHPEKSYTLKKEGNVITQLVITNPEEFWKANKYLVVMVR